MEAIMRLHGIAAFLIVTLAAGSLIPVSAGYFSSSEQDKTIDYDTFGKLGVKARMKAFNEASPENKAELTKTQARRWLDKNRDRLTPEQIAVLEENIVFISPALYRLPRREEDQKKLLDLQARTAALLSEDDIFQAFFLQADYIPPKEKK
jgi:hypothetical protein